LKTGDCPFFNTLKRASRNTSYRKGFQWAVKKGCSPEPWAHRQAGKTSTGRTSFSNRFLRVDSAKCLKGLASSGALTHPRRPGRPFGKKQPNASVVAVSFDGSNALLLYDLGVCFRELRPARRGHRPVPAGSGTGPRSRADPLPARMRFCSSAATPLGAKLRFQQAVRLEARFAVPPGTTWGFPTRPLGELDHGGRVLSETLRIGNRRSRRSISTWGTFRLAQGNFLDAVALLLPEPSNGKPRLLVEALNNLGTALHGLGHSERALEAYTAALALPARLSPTRAQKPRHPSQHLLGRNGESIAPPPQTQKPAA